MNDKKKNILISIEHPAHVHFFKNMIWELKKNGHNVIIIGFDKDITLELLDNYGFEYINLGSYGKSLIAKGLKMFLIDLKICKIVLRYKIQLLLGISIFITHAGFLTRRKSIVFTDTEHATEQIALFKPFATKIYTPDCFLKDLGPKQVRYPGYHELAYLHPNRFKPNVDVLKEIGLNEGDPFFVLRFVSWGASHDIGQKGFSLKGKRKLIEMLKDKGKIIITSESLLPEEFEPYRMNINPIKMHDLLYYAKLYIGEGGTMASEAVVLGTPAILVNTLTAGVFEELEKKYNMIYRITDTKQIIDTTETIISKHGNYWKSKHEIIINDKIDVTQILNAELLKLVCE